MSKIIGAGGLLLGLLLVGSGVATLPQQLSNRTPKTLSFAQFQKENPQSGHFKLTGATICLAESVWVENEISGEVGNIYSPVRSEDGAMLESLSEAPIKILVRIDDPKTRGIADKLVAYEKEKDPKKEAELGKWAEKNAENFWISRPIQGTLAEGIESLDSEEKSMIESSGLKLADDFVILQENTGPNFLATLGMFVVGLGLGFWGLRRISR